MVLIAEWLPASRENYELLLRLWTWYPLFASMQWVVSWYGMGKTSVDSRFNIPGRIGWATMECPGFLTLLYIMRTLPAQRGGAELDWRNKVLAALFVMHYVYRALLFPLLQPAMSPIHVVVWAAALMFQLMNASCIGSWLAAYGPTTQAEWEAQGWSVARFSLGLLVFYLGLVANYFSDEELREIRRGELRRRERQARAGGKASVEKHYSVPQNGLFRFMLYPHYLTEWVEWLGFWIAGGAAFTPARCFLINEIFSMFPRAVAGRRWYRDTFGEDKIKGKYVILPGIY